jgi:RNA-directed DNA polymerase
MSSDSEPTNRGVRPSQPPKPECGPESGQSHAAEGGVERTTFGKRTQGNSQAARGSRIPLKLSSLDTVRHAGGDGVASPEPNKEQTVEGQVCGNLPGSQRVAREERIDRNLGDPADSRRANSGHQTGRTVQRQEEHAQGRQGVRSVRSSQGQGHGPDPGQGTDKTTQPAQETSAVRTTDSRWPTSLRAIAKKAVQDKTHRFGGLYRLLNEDTLRACFFHLRKKAAPGVDGVGFEDYEKHLDANLASLVLRLKNKSYHAGLVRRKYIPKGPGKWRPLGIPTLEDKLLQYAVAQVLSAIYEADFLPCSYGYRPERGPHDAVSNLTDTLFRGRFEFVVEADIKGFFDHIRHDWLLKMLAVRIDDGALLSLIRKWLRAGILEEDGRVEHPDSGTPQGGVVSPVLANVYLHYVLDLWFERRVRKANRGQSRLFRFADDFVCCFDYRHEAVAFEQALAERLKKFGLELAPDKTQILRFGRGGSEQNGRFDFLGFEFRWDKSRLRRQPYVARRTSRKKLRGAVGRFTEWIRAHRHHKVSKLMKTVADKHRGHWNYYGIIGNSKSLGHYRTETCRVLHYWLNRRSQRRSYTWSAFHRLLKRFAVPLPRIREKAKGWLELPERAGWSAEEAARVSLLGEHYVACHALSESS